MTPNRFGLTKEDEAHLDWMSAKYAGIMVDTISLTSITETIINFSIARLITTEKKTAKDIVKHLILKMKFANKLLLLETLLKEKNPVLYSVYSEDIQKMDTVYKLRNRLAHSNLYTRPSEIKKHNKTRIPYENRSASAQVLYITINDADNNKRELYRLNKSFAKMSTAIEAI